jgi:hypothetical protein
MNFTTTDMIMHWKNYHHFRDLSESVEQDTEYGSLQIPLEVRAGFENGKSKELLKANLLMRGSLMYVFKH